eukprot:8844209-Pyramimonas_sp.AAC.1
MSPSALNKGKFIDNLEAVAMTADIEVTCVTGTGSSHIDYLVASVSARPFILGIQARLDVPWGTHCGLVVQLAGS